MKLALLNLFFLVSATAFSVERRKFFESLATAACVTTTVAPSAAQAVLSSKYCASGVGEGCADLSEGNDLIRSLQEKSAANRERNEREAREAFYMKNYPDWFNSIGKTLVKKADGSYLALDDAEIAQLRKDNKLTFETPRTKGGQVVDYTQKPILVLKE